MATKRLLSQITPSAFLARRSSPPPLPTSSFPPSPHMRSYHHATSSFSKPPSSGGSSAFTPGGSSAGANGRGNDDLTTQNFSLDSTTSQGPTLTYWLNDILYVALTNRCNTVPLHVTRGPGFSMQGFSPLPPNYEPTEEEVLTSVMGALSASHALAGKQWTEVCFAGWGEPTLRWDTVLSVADRLRRSKNEGLRLRLNTNGLGNVAQQRLIVPEVQELFDSVSVAVNTVDPGQYDDLMRPNLAMRGESQSLIARRGLDGITGSETTQALAHVLAFTRGCVEAGVKTQITAVARPDVDVGGVEALAKNLGADFRARSYFH